jgi:hypothetical protein
MVLAPFTRQRLECKVEFVNIPAGVASQLSAVASCLRQRAAERMMEKATNRRPPRIHRVHVEQKAVMQFGILPT